MLPRPASLQIVPDGPMTGDQMHYIPRAAVVKGPENLSETFPTLDEKEIRQHGKYRTRRFFLAAWDRMEADGEFMAMAM